LSGDGSLHFAFGPSGSPLPSGYTLATSAAYSAATGSGWDSASIIYDDRRWGTIPAPLTSGFVYGRDATFRVDLPNGTYNVTPTLGDALIGRDDVTVYAQGRLVASNVTTAAGQAARPTFQVQVTSGQLALRLVDQGGADPYFALDTLDIKPATATTTAPTGPTVPAAPTGLKAAVASSNEVDLTWVDNASAGTGTEIERSTDGNQFSVIATVPAGATRYIDTGLSAGSYSYRVVATDGSAVSGTSNTATATLAAPANGAVTIDAAWLAEHGSGPYVLNQPNTTYVLRSDIATPGTAFVVAAAGVTLDLNGHTVTYGNATPVVVNNGGFEQGTGRNVPGWNLAGAPAAAIAPNADGLFGNQALKFSSIKGGKAQTIVSDPITIPEANHTYAATVSMSVPGGTQNSPPASVVIQVYRASDNTLLATGTTGGGYNADGSIAAFTPTTTAPVYLKITVTPTTSSATTIDLDHVGLTPSYDYGVVASNEWNFAGSANLPAAMQWGGSQGYNNAGAFTLTSSAAGGTLAQGPGAGYGGDAVMAQTLNAPLVVNGVTLKVSGEDTSAIEAMNNGTPTAAMTHTITNNTIVAAPGMDVIRRATDIAQIDLARAGGNTIVTGNTITGVPQIGIMINGTPATQAQTSHLIQNNTIVGDTVVTNGYLISAYGLSNLKLLDNTLTAGAGQSAEGINLDSQTSANSSNIEVAGNTVNVRQNPTREYGASIAGRALRIRNDAGGSTAGSFIGLSVHDNTFIGQADATSTRGTVGAWITLVNNPGATAPNSGISFTNNTFKAVAATSDAGASAKALVIDGIDPGINPTFIGNWIESNDISLALNDWDGENVSDVTLTGNTLAKSLDGAARPYMGIRAGYWIDQIHNVKLIDTHVAQGATTAITWSGSGTKDIELGWFLNVSAQDSSGAAISGANVTVTDASGNVVATGVTDSTGIVASLPLITTTYDQNGSDPTAVTVSQSGSFQVRVSSGSRSAVSYVSLSADASVTSVLA
jgi:hypothetical protein